MFCTHICACSTHNSDLSLRRLKRGGVPSASVCWLVCGCAQFSRVEIGEIMNWTDPAPMINYWMYADAISHPTNKAISIRATLPLLLLLCLLAYHPHPHHHARSVFCILAPLYLSCLALLAWIVLMMLMMTMEERCSAQHITKHVDFLSYYLIEI